MWKFNIVLSQKANCHGKKKLRKVIRTIASRDSFFRANNGKFDKWELRGALRLFESFGQGKFSFFSYHESNLSLIARETMRFLVNNQLNPFPIQCKSISLEHSCYERSQAITVILLSPFFDVRKQRH